MSSTSAISEATLANASTSPSVAELLICLPAFAPEALSTAFEAIASAFAHEPILVASANPPSDVTDWPSLELIPYGSARTGVDWVLAAGDYAAAATLAIDRHARSIILLGDAATPVNSSLLLSLASGLKNVDLVLPLFNFGPNNALVNSALLYPLSRALFGTHIHFPLPVDAAFSARMAQHLIATTHRITALNQGSSLLWPAAEATTAGLLVGEVPAGDTTLPTPPHEDFNALFISVAGSLFADIEAKASFWQRARGIPIRPPGQTAPPPFVPVAASAEIHSMIETFHIAQANLQEIWSLVLPPQSRLAIKKLSQLSPDAFIMDPDLWARIVYDFTLAFHLRTLNRSHLLGAMTPLYLAWAASYLRFVADDSTRASHAIETTAAAFESEKPYILSRWRWPDRFNP